MAPESSKPSENGVLNDEQELENLVKYVKSVFDSFTADTSVEEMRAGWESLFHGTVPVVKSTTEKIATPEFQGELITASEAKYDRYIVYLHGGGYVIGSVNSYRDFCERLSRSAKARVLVVDYRLAPENPFPAAVDDAAYAYRWVLSQGDNSNCLIGGIKATFLTDWVHTVVIYIIMIMSLFVVFATSNVVGSSDAMFDLLQNAQKLHPVAGNAEGSYLTMKSVEGGFFGLIILGAGFTRSVDPQLSQKAIAANPGSTLIGYLLGGSAWFTIPFCLATTYGLLAAAVEQLPVFPTYPHPMNAFEVASGMAMPYAALAVMGKGGAMAILLMVFMAVTSALSSETMAVTALMTYDVYQAYINPKATGKQLVRFGHCVVPVFGLFVASVAVGLNHAGFNVSFIITAVGVFVVSAFIPQACTIFWGKQGLLAVVGAPIISSAAAIIAWFMVAKHESGYISITTLSGNLALVAGNMTSFAGPIVLTPLLSYIKPQNYDWNLLKEIKQADDADEGTSGIMELSNRTNLEAEETMTTSSDAQTKAENAMLLRARTKAIWASVSLTLVYLLLWPIPMYGTGYVFSKGFFKGWVVVLFLWAFYAASTITLLPLWEGRHSIIAFSRFLFKSKDKTAAETRVILEGLPENQGRLGDGVSHNVTRSEKCVTADVSQ
ncbi:Na+ solute symporter [Fusarium pseudoanthophilum]|uniref:Na+ solute symporter n=1 Tax=Fusarium pseudoanthophilum TaxID=48495 RepID=A0A8H5L4P9_9HYPO|nr:Na+ solute symporter [Fusarium pseudoanthophilum]